MPRYAVIPFRPSFHSMMLVSCSVLLLVLLVACTGAAERSYFNDVHVCLGPNLGPHVQARIKDLLQQVPTDIQFYNAVKSHPPPDLRKDQLNSNAPSLILGFGDCPWGAGTIPRTEISSSPSESTRIASQYDPTRNSYSIFSNGHVLEHGYTSKDVATPANYGAVAAAYSVLEMLGFGFLHPLSPLIPESLSINTPVTEAVNISETPRWPIRIFHHHTQHPLELTEVMQGLDIPMFGPIGLDCVRRDYAAYNRRRAYEPKDTDHAYCERWEDMVSDVNLLFEWCVANKYNRVEWLLLGNYKWKGFDYSDTRRKRLKILTNLGNQYGLLVGADVPLGNVQQHGWYMVNPRLPYDEQVQQIRHRVDWVFNAGFDFMTTESGLSEFTHPDCSLMRDLLEEFSTYVNKSWGREALVKVHCSPGQTCGDFIDPRTGEPVNFNHLPMFVDGSLGVMPHTIQAYSLTDPVANAYGNANFKEIEDYMHFEAQLGNRSVVYYGETAYWVNVDIDVPLFLPIYGQRRLFDLRRIAQTESRTGHRIDGQMIFDSGWEWGYWLNAVVAARAAWDPMMDIKDEWEAFAKSLNPISRMLPAEVSGAFTDLMVTIVQKQSDLLINGIVNGKPSPDINRLSGMSYLSGSDTWVDVPRLFGVVLTQPDRIRMFETDDVLWKHVVPLLTEMDNVFSGLSNDMDKLYERLLSVAPNSVNKCIVHQDNTCESTLLQPTWGQEALLSEFKDAMRLLALRTRQVRLLYESAAPDTTHDGKAVLLTESRISIAEAQRVVQQREEVYKVPIDRIGGWRENPTVYGFSYVWAVHSLFYWWRDQGLAERGSVQSHYSPCYLNRMDASEVAVGWGKYTLEVLRSIIHYFSPDSSRNPVEIVNCITAPSKEYVFPRDLYIY